MCLTIKGSWILGTILGEGAHLCLGYMCLCLKRKKARIHTHTFFLNIVILGRGIMCDFLFIYFGGIFQLL